MFAITLDIDATRVREIKKFNNKFCLLKTLYSIFGNKIYQMKLFKIKCGLLLRQKKKKIKGHKLPYHDTTEVQSSTF